MTHHPDLHLIDVRCSSCGTSFTTRSTATKLSVDVCSACHPAYTGRVHGAISTAPGTIPAGRKRRFHYDLRQRRRRPQPTVPRPRIRALDALRRPHRASVLPLDAPLARPFLLGIARRSRLRRRHRLRVLPQRAARRPHQRLEPRARRGREAVEVLRPHGMQYLDSTYTNQRDEVICKALGLTARHERKASREKGKYKEVKTTVYSPKSAPASTRRC